VLKGWLDRVFRPGVAYDFQGPEFAQKQRVPLLAGMRGMVFATSDRERPQAEGTIERTWRESVFEFCGIAPHEIRVFYEVRDSSRRTRKRWLASVSEAARRFASAAG
jgi:putative NADPH-quinone reductase